MMNKNYPVIPSSSNDDYISCNNCSRKYNENAYAKHKDGCERRAKEANMKIKSKIGNNTNTFTSSKLGMNANKKYY